MRWRRMGLIALLVAALSSASGCAHLAESIGSGVGTESPNTVEPDDVSVPPTPASESDPAWMSRDSCSRPYGDPPLHPAQQEIESFLAGEPWIGAGDAAWASAVRDHGGSCFNIQDYGCRRPVGLELGQVSAFSDLRNGVTRDILHYVVSAEGDAEDIIRWAGTILGACALETPVRMHPDAPEGDSQTLISVVHALELPPFAEQQVCLTFEIFEPDGVTPRSVTHSCHAATGVVRVYFELEETPDDPMTTEELSALFSELANEAFALQDAQ